MQRRDALKRIATAGSMVAIAPWTTLRSDQQMERISDRDAFDAIEKLKQEPAAKAQIIVKDGGPRLYVNGKRIYPLLALSTTLLPTLDNYTRAGIHYYNTILGMRSGWKGPDQYDWSIQDGFMGRVLRRNPNAYFFPRLQLNTPNWWKESHPDEMIKYGFPPPDKRHNIIKDLKLSEGGHYMGSGREVWEASLASESWRRDTGEMLRNYIRHIQNSPLKSRIIGYHFTLGRTGEWNYYGAAFLPDYSTPMKRVCGYLPSVKERTQTTYGLFRDPQEERKVIDFYQAFHNTVADAILYLAKVIREETAGEVLSGVYYGYILEQVRIQEGGYLAAERIIKSPDIDVLMSPYTYQGNNFKGDENQKSGMVDDAGNRLGRARGVGGDGGFRIPPESVRRHNKLYISEIDPSTYQADKYHGVGGPGSDTVKGSQNILRRDLGQVFACGVGGWLYDFGPRYGSEQGWFRGKPLIDVMKTFADNCKIRTVLNTSPVADMLAVYDAKSFCATEHWLAGEPWEGYGIGYCDFFNHWFINSQARALHRIGSPMDFIYRFDLTRPDPKNYKLIFMFNCFYMDKKEVDYTRSILHNSGTTVVWFYAPGLISPEKINKEQMQRLTGFAFREQASGPMMINSKIKNNNQQSEHPFGLWRQAWPRFSVTDEDAEILGRWMDNDSPAFARKEMDGWTSVYVGTAPLPVEILRWLAQQTEVSLWSSKADNVRAIQDAAMIVASSPSGERTLSLPKPMRPIEGGAYSNKHRLNMEFGEVRLFVA